MGTLLREVIGDVLRRARIDQGRTLREVSDAARVSLGYLSEVERGRKEASSELLSASKGNGGDSVTSPRLSGHAKGKQKAKGESESRRRV